MSLLFWALLSFHQETYRRTSSSHSGFCPLDLLGNWGGGKVVMCVPWARASRSHPSPFGVLATYISRIRKNANTEPNSGSGCSHVVCILSQHTNHCFFQSILLRFIFGQILARVLYLQTVSWIALWLWSTKHQRLIAASNDKCRVQYLGI